MDIHIQTSTYEFMKLCKN